MPIQLHHSEFDVLIHAINNRDYTDVLSHKYTQQPRYLLALYYIMTYKLEPEWKPDYRAPEIGLQTILLAIEQSLKRPDSILASYHKHGSLDYFINKHWTSPQANNIMYIQTLDQLITEFRKVSIKSEESYSRNEQVQSLSRLLASLPSKDQFIFVVRWFMGDLKSRLRRVSVEHMLAKTIAQSMKGNHKHIQDITHSIVRSINICPDYELQFTKVSTYQDIPKIGVPIRAMLLKKSVKDSKHLNAAFKHHLYVQPKIDGMRLQIHFTQHANRKPQVRLYSRNSYDITQQLSQLTERITDKLQRILSSINKLQVKTCIIEGELVSIGKDGRVQPLQQVMHRDQNTAFRLILFDIMLLGNQSLVDERLDVRMQLLKQHFASGTDIIQVIPTLEFGSCESSLNTTTAHLETNTCSKLIKQAVIMKYEGIVLKRADSKYLAGERTYKWIGLKHGYFDSTLADSFDLIVVGYYNGTGIRSGLVGSLLLASLSANGDLDIICRCGQGFTIADIKVIYKTLKPLVQPMPDERIDKSIVNKMRDILWVVPRVAVEVRAQNITQSPTYTIGLSLRHPVFVRVRPDKSIDDISTSKDIIAAYK